MASEEEQTAITILSPLAMVLKSSKAVTFSSILFVIKKKEGLSLCGRNSKERNKNRDGELFPVSPNFWRGKRKKETKNAKSSLIHLCLS